MYSSFYRNLTQLQTKTSFLAAAYIHSVQILSGLAEAVLAVQKHNLDLWIEYIGHDAHLIVQTDSLHWKLHFRTG